MSTKEKPKEPTLLDKARDLAFDRAIRRYAADAAQWKGKYQASLKDLEIAEARLEFVDGIRDGGKNPATIKPIKGAGDATAIIVLSDWHCGEKVNLDQTNGLNEYTPDIFIRRVRSMFQHAVMMIEFARKFAKIDQLKIMVLGDMITGHIHEELKKSNPIFPTEETILFLDELKTGLVFLEKELKPRGIEVWTKPGNHSRFTEKIQIKNEHLNSFEWLGYKIAEKHFEIPKTRFVIEPGYHSYVDINGHVYRIHHGHAIRFKGGVGGPFVPISQKLHHWNKTRVAYRDLMGHLHQFMPMTNCVVNSSLIGYSEFSVFNGFSYEPPSQTLIVDSAKRGSILTEPIFCD